MTQYARARAHAEYGPARIIEIEPDTCCAGAWANVSLTLWQNRGTGPAVERVARVGNDLRAQYPFGVSSVHLIREGAGLPTPEGRDALVKLMNTNTEQLGCVGIVVGGTGFWASAIRSLITGMRAVSSRAYQLKLAGSIDELVSWLPEPHLQRTGMPLDSADFARALEVANQWRADRPSDV